MPAAITESVAEPPAKIAVGEGCVPIDGLVHADCVTVTVFPATVSVALREVPMLGATVNAVVPLPVPLVPDVIVIHVLSVELDHMQLALVVTAIDPVPPLVSNANDAGAAL